MQKRPKQLDTAKYRAQAVRLVTEQKKTVPQADRGARKSVKALANGLYQGRPDRG